jgi:copper chaperone CopZ
VKKALNGIDGIENATVDLEAGRATFDATQPVDLEVVKERIKKAGFEVV